MKTHFTTREGLYILMDRPNFDRIARSQCQSQHFPPMKVSFLSLKKGGDDSPSEERVLFNAGRDLLFFPFNGLNKPVDQSRPLDRRVYKGSFPSCHSFNLMTRSLDSVHLIIGFSTGPIQLFNPIKREVLYIFNEDGTVDKTAVTCVQWVQGTESLFLASHRSGNLYLFNKDLPCSSHSPHYTLVRTANDCFIYHNKNKAKNPQTRWIIGKSAINQFEFSPDLKHIAVVSQDGILRVLDYPDGNQMVSQMKSYFGGLLCLSWSPDGRFIATGGEDDLVLIWSVEGHPVARGEAHQSWISTIRFDPYVFGKPASSESLEVWKEGDDDVEHPGSPGGNVETPSSPRPVLYRLGSVGQDTALVLWDLYEDDLVQKPQFLRSGTKSGITRTSSLSQKKQVEKQTSNDMSTHENWEKVGPSVMDPTVVSLEALALEDLNSITPVVNKKITHEWLTDLVFREDCVVTVSQDGAIQFWARPGQVKHLNGETNQSKSIDSTTELSSVPPSQTTGEDKTHSSPGTVV